MSTIHLVPHTHWDREWYRPFQSFRMQLVDLVDRVLDMLDADPAFAFTLDGQLATVDDYLEIRPDQEQRLRDHVRSGRLAIGPWQILMDEFLVSGETIVRNLERGWDRANDFGGPMRAGYLPDMFGHVAQMPQLLRAAGLSDAIVWRGVPAAIDRHRFAWAAPDGSRVRAEYLPAGYGNAAYLFSDPARLEAAAERFAGWAAPWFGDDPVLAMYGTDHTAPIPELTALVERLNRLRPGSTVKVDTLAAYLRAAAPLIDTDPEWRGEMRSGARANVLMGVASARIDIKQAAGRAETVLERYAEPLTALHVAANAWPSAFLRLAWGKVIENSAHDSICGCSVDPVVSQVLVRFAEAEQVGSTLTRRVTAAVASMTPRGSVAMLNPTPAPRSSVLEAELSVPDEWTAASLELPDGSLAGTQELRRKRTLLFDGEVTGRDADEFFRRFHGREVFDHSWNAYSIEGRTITFDVDVEPDPAFLDADAMRAAVAAAMLSAPDETWRALIVARPRRTLAASVPLPALGWTAVRPVEGDGPIEHAVSDEGRSLDNGLLRIEVAPDGSLALVAADGTRADGIGRVVDGGDVGDSYNYGPPLNDVIVEVPRRVRIDTELPGPVIGRLRVTRTYDWPSSASDGLAGRSHDAEPTDVIMTVELRAGEPFARMTIAFDNHATDHRVRFHAPLPHRASASFAEGQFAVVERGLSGEGGYREEPIPTYPAHGWVDAGGLAILLDHIGEYEVTADGSEIALTLLRSIGLISRYANPYRLDPAGPELLIPNAQMRGPWTIGFGLFPHAGDWAEGGVDTAAEQYRHPPVWAHGTGTADPAWPPAHAGEGALNLRGEQVDLSSLRRRPDGWLELRLVNLAGEARKATITGGVLEARETSLLGEPGAALAVSDGQLRLDLRAAEVRTVQLRRRESALGRADVLDAAGPRQNG